MTCGLMLLMLAVAAVPQERVLDDFSFASEAEARTVWVAAERTPQVGVAADEGRRVVTLGAPFASVAELNRSVLDRQVELNLSAPGQFELEIAVDAPDVCGRLTLYFRSGSGWFGASGTVLKSGWQKVRFSKAAFRPEGTPAGWDQINGIRLACWRSGAKDATIRLRRLTAQWSDVALVIPTASEHPGDSEVDSALSAAESVGSLLEELGLGADAVEDSTLAAGGLGSRSVAILAYHPRLSESATEALVAYVEGGGKVFCCYGMPGGLAEALGFRRGSYHRPPSGTLAEMRFDAADIQGLPEVARQASWNITTAEPAGHNARVIATWFDSQGKPTGLPAMLISDRGAYMTHIVLGDDRASKRQMLAAVLGRLAPTLWERMAAAAFERVEQVGHFDTTEALIQSIHQCAECNKERELVDGLGLVRTAKELSEAGRHAEAVKVAKQAHEQLIDVYLRSQPSRPVEGRAWWNHTGTGAYSGDWERTARELSESGFNMILPNMLWAGRAHYPSEVLPRSRTYAQYGDQIEQCLAAARKYGLEVHVWKVNHNLSGAPSEFVEKLRAEGRLQVFVSGESQPWLCPSHPRNLRLEVDSMIEVARLYDVDGLHFDYIRYPGSHSCYCDGCRERFQEDTGLKVERWPSDCYSGEHKAAYGQWRCDQISRLVRTVHEEAKRLRPELQISAAVFGSYPSCRESVAQDWPEWIKAGWLDFVCPMDYTGSDAAFCGLVENQLKLVNGRIPVYPGIGATASRSRLTADRVAGQVLHARRLGAAGFTVFDLNSSTAREILPGLKLGATSEKAQVPQAGTDE